MTAVYLLLKESNGLITMTMSLSVNKQFVYTLMEYIPCLNAFLSLILSIHCAAVIKFPHCGTPKGISYLEMSLMIFTSVSLFQAIAVLFLPK